MGFPATDLPLRSSKLPPKPRSSQDVAFVAARWVEHLDALPHVEGLDPVEALHRLRVLLACQAARHRWHGQRLAIGSRDSMKALLSEIRATLLVKELTLCLAALERLD